MCNPSCGDRAGSTGSGRNRAAYTQPYRGPLDCPKYFGVIDIPDGEADTVADHLNPFPNTSVKWVAASHYHADHLGGIDDFLTVQDVDTVYDRGGDRNAYDSETYRSYFDVVTSVPGVRQTSTSAPPSRCAQATTSSRSQSSPQRPTARPSACQSRMRTTAACA